MLIHELKAPTVRPHTAVGRLDRHVSSAICMHTSCKPRHTPSCRTGNSVCSCSREGWVGGRI